MDLMSIQIVAVLDSSRKIDEWNVDNITLNGNLISTTDNDGDLVIHPNGTGDVVIPDDSRIGFGGGANGTGTVDAFIKYDEAGVDRLEIGGSGARFSNTTQATSKDTGSVIFEGGIGVEKNVVLELQVTSYRHSQVQIIRYSLTHIQMD